MSVPTIAATHSAVTEDDELLVLCQEPACIEHGQMHRAVDRLEPWFLHHGLELTGEKWRVSVTLDEFFEHEWRLDIAVEDNHLTSADGAALAVALTAAAAECNRLNTTQQVQA
ncbi:hypothetical protein [Rathayibacter sp. AY1A7]|uniref:hypothetical protein n=1 Tax=Rathayibacter sp. AY1A7 TaxID=2080524 RepID=UPI000CE84E66|nr:hypothetical protein [Rathayibacter sp. AY1A7]PPF14485.1 hypothetical protein C5B95_16910 [Rathayibacter sp. AY1A7]